MLYPVHTGTVFLANPHILETTHFTSEVLTQPLLWIKREAQLGASVASWGGAFDWPLQCQLTVLELHFRSGAFRQS